MEYKIKTKFDVDDIVIGFPTSLPTKLKIDRIEISFERFDTERPEFTRYRTIYLATPAEDKFASQRRYAENELFTKEELQEYVNSFLDKL